MFLLSLFAASWGSNGEEDGEAPQIKLARYFSLDDLRKITDGFSEDNAIGSGGYGKVMNTLYIMLSCLLHVNSQIDFDLIYRPSGLQRNAFRRTARCH